MDITIHSVGFILGFSCATLIYCCAIVTQRIAEKMLGLNNREHQLEKDLIKHEEQIKETNKKIDERIVGLREFEEKLCGFEEKLVARVRRLNRGDRDSDIDWDGFTPD